MAAVGELDYRPSGVGAVAAHAPHADARPHRHRHPEPVLSGARPGGRRRGPRRSATPSCSGSAAYDEHRAMHYLDLMVDRRVDGMIIASSQVSQASWQWLLRSPVPVVVVNAEPAGLPVPVITGDNVGGPQLAIRYLIGLGHRRIAYVQGSPTFTADAARVDGVPRACAEAGLDPRSHAGGRGRRPVRGRRPRRRDAPRRATRTSPRSPATTTSRRSASCDALRAPAGTSRARSASSAATTSPPRRGSSPP